MILINFKYDPQSAFHLSPQDNVDDISDSSVILAGPGNTKIKSSSKGSVLQAVIGCEGRIWVEEAPMVHQLKEQAREGVITEVLGLPLTGWRVKTESRPSFNRKKRADLDDFSGI